MAYAILGLQPRDQAAMLVDKATHLFQKYHNTLRCLCKLLHKHCFQFLLGLTIAPKEIAQEKVWRDNKEYYGIFEKRPIHFFFRGICIKAFSSQRRETLMFLSINMTAVTSSANQQYLKNLKP